VANPAISGSLAMRLSVDSQGSAQLVAFFRNSGRGGGALAREEPESLQLNLGHRHLGGDHLKVGSELGQVVQPAGLGIDESQCFDFFNKANPGLRLRHVFGPCIRGGDHPGQFSGGERCYSQMRLEFTVCLDFSAPRSWDASCRDDLSRRKDYLCTSGVTPLIPRQPWVNGDLNAELTAGINHGGRQSWPDLTGEAADGRRAVECAPLPVFAQDGWKDLKMPVAVWIPVSVPVMRIGQDEATSTLPPNGIVLLHPDADLFDFEDGHGEHGLEHMVHGLGPQRHEPMGNFAMHRDDHFFGQATL